MHSQEWDWWPSCTKHNLCVSWAKNRRERQEPSQLLPTPAANRKPLRKYIFCIVCVQMRYMLMQFTGCWETSLHSTLCGDGCTPSCCTPWWWGNENSHFKNKTTLLCQTTGNSSAEASQNTGVDSRWPHAVSRHTELLQIFGLI